jgi:hypothetical protein
MGRPKAGEAMVRWNTLLPVKLLKDIGKIAEKKGYSSTSAFVRALLQTAVKKHDYNQAFPGIKPPKKVITEDQESAASIAARIKQMAIDELTPKKPARIFPDEDGWDDDPEPKPDHPWHPLFGKQCKRCGRYHDEEGICGCESVSTW